MTSQILTNLKRHPHTVLDLSSSDNDILLFFKNIVKELLDPLAQNFSVLDEVYVENLDSQQVFGQARIILDAIGENFISERIPSLRKKLGTNEEEQSDEEDNPKDAEDSTVDENESENEDPNERENSENGSESENRNDKEEPDEDSIHYQDLVDKEDDAGDSSEGDISDSDKGEFSNNQGDWNDDDQFSDAHEAPDTDQDQRKESGESKFKKDVFGLNDGFFDIDDFNKQILALENEDKQDNDDDDIDYFQDAEDGDDDESMAYFDDFFDQPKSKAQEGENFHHEGQDQEEIDQVDNKDFDEDDYGRAMDSVRLDLFADEDKHTQKDPETSLSSFEGQQRKLQKEIGDLENELVAEKEWTMKGEVQANERPQDSLLNEGSELDFERISKPVPIITDQVTSTIEDLIKKRIKNEEFDDVVRRILPDIGRAQNRQKAELSDQKSSKSLAEIYEDEYQNNDEGAQKSEELQKQHDDISDLFGKVIYQLDSLTSAHFVPKPKEFKTTDIKVSDAASVNMEDAQPLHISDSSTLAPQEIYKAGDDIEGKSSFVPLKSGLSYSKEELSRAEKMRLRRANKRKRSKSFKESKDLKRHKELQAGLSHNNDSNKRYKANDAANTLKNTNNVTIIDKEGKQRDTKGHIKAGNHDALSSGYKL